MKYARNGVPERTTGSCVVGEYSKHVANRRTYVSDRDGEKEEKYPKVQIEPLARGSGLAGNPKCKESEQPSSVEGNGQISLRRIRFSHHKKNSRCVPYQRDKKCHDAERFHSTIADDSPT